MSAFLQKLIFDMILHVIFSAVSVDAFFFDFVSFLVAFGTNFGTSWGTFSMTFSKTHPKGGFAVLGRAPEVPPDQARAPRKFQKGRETPENRCQNHGCP